MRRAMPAGRLKQVAEVYSPPIMIQAARKISMEAGFALDLTTVDEESNQWDFSQERMRAKALQLLDDKQPAILIVSPPCTMFSSLQQLNIAKMKDEDISARAKDAATHFAFVVMLCVRQSLGNRLFALVCGGASSGSIFLDAVAGSTSTAMLRRAENQF